MSRGLIAFLCSQGVTLMFYPFLLHKAVKVITIDFSYIMTWLSVDARMVKLNN